MSVAASLTKIRKALDLNCERAESRYNYRMDKGQSARQYAPKRDVPNQEIRYFHNVGRGFAGKNQQWLPRVRG